MASNLPSFPNRKNGVALRKVGMTTSFFFRMFIFTTMDQDCEVLDRILKARFVLQSWVCAACRAAAEKMAPW